MEWTDRQKAAWQLGSSTEHSDREPTCAWKEENSVRTILETLQLPWDPGETYSCNTPLSYINWIIHNGLRKISPTNESKHSPKEVWRRRKLLSEANSQECARHALPGESSGTGSLVQGWGLCLYFCLLDESLPRLPSLGTFRTERKPFPLWKLSDLKTALRNNLFS